MKNCLIIGSGRCGTSMLGGIMHDAGYFMGENLYSGNPSNPKGFFECGEINDLNEDILNHYNHYWLPHILYKIFRVPKPKSRRRQQWLLSIPPQIAVDYSNSQIDKRIQSALEKQPFCYKDPRFSYTLPVWKQHLNNQTRFICVFRSPNITVNSILKECASRRYLRNLYINTEYAIKAYVNIYSHILTKNAEILDKIFFVHYEQILDGSALSKMSEFLNVELSNKFADSKLRRTQALETISDGAIHIYSRLCDLAGYEEKYPYGHTAT